MSLAKQMAKHLRDVHFGGNWTTVNVKDTLADVTWQQAVTKVQSFNTIATLVFHISYFVDAVIPVFEGGALDAHDKYSFDHPPISSAEDWEAMLARAWVQVEKLAVLVEEFPEVRLLEAFADTEKYGNYYRNIAGIIEHTHYHLGQIVIIKKLLTRG